jgi:hypothetical protein
MNSEQWGFEGCFKKLGNVFEHVQTHFFAMRCNGYIATPREPEKMTAVTHLGLTKRRTVGRQNSRPMDPGGIAANRCTTGTASRLNSTNDKRFKAIVT